MITKITSFRVKKYFKVKKIHDGEEEKNRGDKNISEVE